MCLMAGRDSCSVYPSYDSYKDSEWEGISPLYFGVVNFLLIFLTYSHPHLWGLTWGPYDATQPIGFSWIFFANSRPEGI